MRISPADQAFSRCVRERDDWICQKCKTRYPRNSSGLHCSHHFSRRYRTIRWHPLNAMVLCYACHQWYGGNPLDSGRWLEAKIGPEAVAELRVLRDTPRKISKKTEKEIAAHYRRELKVMEKKRTDGVEGRVEFNVWGE